jgi:hypothetical protein
VQARVEFFELLRPAFDVELATRDVGGPLAEGALEVLQLDELRGALLLMLLGEPARETQQLLPAGIILRLLPGSFPPERLPGIPLLLHSLERSATRGGFGRSEQGKTMQRQRPRSVPMPSKKANVKNEKQYEALKDKGMSKERAAKIANSPGASSRGGKKSHSGSSRSSSRQGGTTAQKQAAGRKGGKAAARKS